MLLRICNSPAWIDGAVPGLHRRDEATSIATRVVGNNFERERSDRRGRSAPEELRLWRTKQTRPGGGGDERFGQKWRDEHERAGSIGRGMSVENANRAGNLRCAQVCRIGDALDQHPWMDVGGGD
jgi:hypothetical protein